MNISFFVLIVIGHYYHAIGVVYLFIFGYVYMYMYHRKKLEMSRHGFLAGFNIKPLWDWWSNVEIA